MHFHVRSCRARSTATAFLAAAFFAAPAAAQTSATRDLSVEQKIVADFSVPASDLKLTTWVDRQSETYAIGDTVQIQVRTNRDAYITVINVGTSGKVHVLFPNKHHSDNRVLAHQVLQVPGPDAAYRIRVGGPPGNDLIKVIATIRPESVIRPERLSEQGPFFSYDGPTESLTRDLSVELSEKDGSGTAATVNKIIRIMPGNAAAVQRLPLQPTSHAMERLSAEELFRLGETSFYGEGTTLNHREALRIFRLAATAGHVGAMYRIGQIHETGREVDADPSIALQWYRKAAELGNTQSMVRMALIHARTSGPQRDYAEAVRWLKKAASQGDGVALMNLGKMHDEGVAVARVPREAARYILSSLKAGAWVMLDQASRLTEETRREIQDQLRRAGYYSGPIDGLIGPETRAAMIEFARAGT